MLPARILVLILALVAGATAPSGAGAQSAPAPALSPQLQESIAVARLYSSDAPLGYYGNYAYLTLATTAGRSQNVFITGSQVGPAGARMRRIFSWVAKVAPPVDTALATRLLRENDSVLPYGYWALMRKSADAPLTLAYVVEVSVDAPAAAIQEVVNNVARRADALEAELTGKDIF